jgi:cob(I)alamin adenosyltransferase
MVVVFTGNGKGKTTATIGQMIRAVGQGKKAVMFQFIKGPWISGEHKFLNKYKVLRDKLEIQRGGKGFVGILGDKLPIKSHKKAAEDTLKKAAKAIKSRKWDIVALDEVNIAASLGLIKVSEVLKVVKKEPQNMIIVLSGRNAPSSFIKRADLVTEMREVKHPFNKGERAKAGFEF